MGRRKTSINDPLSSPLTRAASLINSPPPYSSQKTLNGGNLTALEAQFVSEYLIDGNGAAAYRRAKLALPDGSSTLTDATIASNACNILKKTAVRSAIEAGFALKRKRNEVTADWVIVELKNVYEKCGAATPVLDAAGAETGLYQFDAANSIKALETVGKALGMFGNVVGGRGGFGVGITLNNAPGGGDGAGQGGTQQPIEGAVPGVPITNQNHVKIYVNLPELVVDRGNDLKQVGNDNSEVIDGDSEPAEDDA